jgi:serine/threonine protein kinase
MGVVYKARDLHLDRFVAIKVLPPGKMDDPERKRRFVQEAKAASALNHPNIITIHDIASDDGVDFIVMEYAEGRPLDYAIPRHGMRLGQALRIGIDIADALARAHAAGIIHRDLKPANVILTERGVKLVDFGVAKLFAPGEADETETMRAEDSGTGKGAIVGTTPYMSPEQAQGKKIDARSDIFSFGALLYEMLTGRRAFEGDSNVSVIAAILKEEPKPPERPFPRDLQRLIARCLRKDPERRFQTMADLKVALAELKEETDSGSLTDVVPATAAAGGRRSLAWAAGALALSAVVASLWLYTGRAERPSSEPQVLPLTTDEGSELTPTFSPDGNQLAYSWEGPKLDNFDIYVRMIGSPAPLRLTTDPARDTAPAWSPDGRTIAFWRVSSDFKLTVMRIPPLGGVERKIADIGYLGVAFPGSWGGMAWSPDGNWLAVGSRASPGEPSAIYLVSAETGEKRKMTNPPPTSPGDWGPSFSPDGRLLAFARSASAAGSVIQILGLDAGYRPDGEPSALTAAEARAWDPTFTSTGQEILFASGSFVDPSLWRVPMFTGGPRQRVAIAGSGATGPAIPKQGTRMAYVRLIYEEDIWRLPLRGPGLAAGPSEPFIASTRNDAVPAYSPDGQQLVFASNRSGATELWLSAADGSNPVQLTGVSPDGGTSQWSPDGQQIAFDSHESGHYQVFTIGINGENRKQVTSGEYDNAAPSYSRDGRWIYFLSLRTGRYEIWKTPASGGDAVPVTKNGGHLAMESFDGETLYYTKRSGGAVWSMPAGGGEERRALPSVLGARVRGRKGRNLLHPGAENAK